jgi:hypothetical protein
MLFPLPHEDNAHVPPIEFAKTMTLIGVFQQKIGLYPRKWQRDIFRDSSWVMTHHTSMGFWRVFRDKPEWLTLGIMEKAVLEHNQLVAQRPEFLVKNDKKRRLSRFQVEENSVIVKEFVRPGPWGPWAADSRSWICANRLHRIGLPVCRYLAWLKAKHGCAYILMEDLGPQDLYAELIHNRADRVKLKELLTEAGHLIGILHNLGVHPRDLKIRNFVPCYRENPKSLELKLIDLDDILFFKVVPDSCRSRNAEQIISTLPDFLDQRQKLLLLAAYHRETGIEKQILFGLLSRFLDERE